MVFFNTASATRIFTKHRTIYTAQYIFVANHISYLDIPATVRCYRSAGADFRQI